MSGAYHGRRGDDGAAVSRPDGSALPLDPSLALRRHSPTGFDWGYGGSGPAQLALALLLDVSGNAGRALDLYQLFKVEVVALLPREGWLLDAAELRAWLAREAVR
ncbi:MAG: hypothetical protein F4X35_03080 [Alphaproteobacteria bacterium]|nr:hypothetical protein [Alphaproteobacteria bacterium]